MQQDQCAGWANHDPDKLMGTEDLPHTQPWHPIRRIGHVLPASRRTAAAVCHLEFAMCKPWTVNARDLNILNTCTAGDGRILVGANGPGTTVQKSSLRH